MKKQRWEESEKRRETRENIREKRKEPENRRCRRAKKAAKSRNIAGTEPSGQMRDDKLHAVVARSIFEVKMDKIHYARTTFGSCDVEKVHTVVVRSTFRSQNVQHPRAGPLFDVAMSKKCTPLRHAAHVEVKNGKLAGTEHFCKS